MTERFAGKVAFVTGAARGQGRSHALRLAQGGADIIAIDACTQIPTIPYALATEEDFDLTRELLEKTGRQIVTRIADVRDYAAVKSALDDGVAELGRLDFVIANAGVCSFSEIEKLSEEMWADMLAVNATGTFHTVKAAVPHLRRTGDGGAIVITSSSAGLRGHPNIVHYTAAKHAVVGIMKALAIELAPDRIRVNTIHPTQVNTPMIQNDAAYHLFVPHKAEPTRDDFEAASLPMNLLPVPWVEPGDISDTVAFLCSDEAKYITGVTLPVDAGQLTK